MPATRPGAGTIQSQTTLARNCHADVASSLEYGASVMSHMFDTPIGAGEFALLVLALLVAYGFEFVNGFHDTANAVATVIYTKTLKPWYAVIISGGFNFLGVYLGGIAVAMAIIKLLPVELLTTSGGAGMAMVLALLWRVDSLERRHVVPRPPRVQLAHAHRRDHRRRRGELLAPRVTPSAPG